MAEMVIGDPGDIATDVGPVIDKEALKMLQTHARKMAKAGTKIAEAPLDKELKSMGISLRRKPMKLRIFRS